jgi:YjbE family integral membrane protein
MTEFFATLSWVTVLQIIMVDLLLGGDNAVVIALACRNLKPERRMQGILWGTAGAIFLRVALISFALVLLSVPFVKLVGGLLLLWIGVKLMAPENGEAEIAGSTTVWSAVKTIIVADFVMSLDNIVAIAGAAQNAHADHQVILVIFGLVVSVPIIIWGSTLLLKLIDRYPVIVTLGAGLLGWIAGGMLVSDLVVARQFGEPDATTKLAAEVTGAVLVVMLGRWRAARNPSGETIKEESA